MKAENMVCCLLAAGVVAADQAAKASVKKNVKPGEKKYLSPKTGRTIEINHVKNYGMAGNVGEESPDMVKKISLGMTAATAASLAVSGIGESAAEKHGKSAGAKKAKYALRKAGLSLALGGAVSNCIDRFRDGCVTDYITVHTKEGGTQSDRTSFNIADAGIIAGLGLTLLSLPDQSGKTAKTRKKKN
jgi:lipoprotein signal peptidase